jgi:two-component system chemotaxis sensor kinase CheA
MSQQDKYAQLFAAEAREHLAEMSRALIALEEAPDDRESLDSIFRSVHTIKGMAGAMGYDEATRLAHNIESVLDELRGERREVNPDLIDLLLESTDLLDNAVESTVAGQAPPDPTATIERLVLWRLQEEGVPAVEAAAPVAPASDIAPQAGERQQVAQPPERPARRPGSSRVRVDIRRLDALMNLLGELTIVRGRLRSLVNQAGSELMQDLVEEAGSLISEMQLQVVESRMVPVWQIFDRFPRLVRDAARSAEKEVEIEIAGKELELDRSMLDAINDPLVHLLRNAVDHGIEPPDVREKAGKPRAGRIELSARRERSRVVIVVRDDGRGIDRQRVSIEARNRGLLPDDVEPSDQELLRIMARPGFSTAERVTSLSGRGVGLNVVEDTIRGVGGSVELRSEEGLGSTFLLELPLTLVIMPALIVEVAGESYALPATFTRESFEAAEGDVIQAHGREWVTWRDRRLPLTRLQNLLSNGEGNGGDNGGKPGVLSLVALEFGGRQLAVSVDRLVAEEEIVVKSFDPPRGAVPVFSGATVRPDGRPALVLDIGNLS